MGSDGSLRFDTKINTAGFENGVSSIRRAAESCAKAAGAAGQGINQSFNKSTKITSLENQIAQTEEKIRLLNAEMAQIGAAKVPTEEYKIYCNLIEKTQRKLVALKAQEDKLKSQGVKHNTSRWKNLQYDITETTNTLKSYEKELQDVIAEGQAFTSGQDSAAYAKKAAAIDALNNRLYVQKQRLLELIASEGGAANEAARLKAIADNAQVGSQKIVDLNNRLLELQDRQRQLKAAGIGPGYEEYDANSQEILSIMSLLKQYKKGLNTAGENSNQFSRTVRKAFGTAGNAVTNFAKKVSKGLVNKTKEMVSGLKGLGKSSNKVSQSILKLSNMFKLMLIRMAMRAAIQGVREGMQNLVQYSASANQAMSNLVSNMTYLKNSFASAFAPIITFIAPALNLLISLLITATNCINQFFSALSGGTTFVRAKKVNQDYAKSLKETGGAAKQAGKDAKKALAPFDELNQMQENSSGGSGGGGGGADVAGMFETATINESLRDFINELKELYDAGDWEGIGRVLGNKINEAVQRFTDFISWDRIGKKITSFVTAFTVLFNSLVSTIDWYAIGIMMGTGINTIANTLYLLLTQIDWMMLGNKLSQSLMGVLNTVDWELFGRTLGAYVQAKISGILGFIVGVDWGEIGRKLSECITGITGEINWEQLGYLLAAGLNGAFALLLQFAVAFDWTEFGKQIANSISTFFQTFDWAQAGEALSQFVIGILDFLITVVQETDWEAFVQGIVDCIEAIDWISLAGGIYTLFSGSLGTVFGMLSQLIGTLIVDGVIAAKNYFSKEIDDCGGNVALGILNGILKAWKGIQQWIVDHVFLPFINGVLKAFGISGASSAELDKLGPYLWNGFCNGIKKAFSSVGTFIKDSITDPFINGIKNLLGIHSPSTVMEEIGDNTVAGFNQGVEGGQASSQSIIQTWAAGVSKWFASKLGISSNEAKESKEWADSLMSGYNNTITQNYIKSQAVMEKWAESVRNWFIGSGESKGVNEVSWKKYAENIIKAFNDSIGTGSNASKAPLENWAKNVQEWFWGVSYSSGNNGLYQVFYNMAKLVNQGFAEGISAFSNLAKNAVQKWAGEIIDSAKSELDIHSPSREAFSIAEYFAQGFNNGLLSMAESSRKTAEKWLDRVTDVFEGVSIDLPVGMNIPNAASYLPRMASGTVAPPRAGEYETSRTIVNNRKEEEDLLEKIQELIFSMKILNNKSGGDVRVYLEGEAGGVFRLVKKENDAYRDRMGESAFI